MQSGSRCSNAASHSSGSGSAARPSAATGSVYCFKALSQFGGIGEFVKAVGQFDAVIVELESFGDLVASGVDRCFGECRL